MYLNLEGFLCILGEYKTKKEDETVHSLHQLETSLRKLHDFERFPSHRYQQTGKLTFLLFLFVKTNFF